MGVEVIGGLTADEIQEQDEKHDYVDSRCVLVCNTSDWAFGPIFNGREEAEAFLTWSRKYKDDVRRWGDGIMDDRVLEFRKEREALA